MLDSQDVIEPWYKQFWPWFLIALPLITVIVCISLFITAQRNAPTLVSEHYYKDGLAYNMNKELEKNAIKLGISVEVIASENIFTLHLKGLKDGPKHIDIKLQHPTLAKYDQLLSLEKIADDIYQSPFSLLKDGKWYVTIDGPENAWEIKTEALLPNI